MSVTATMIANVIAAAETAFPSKVLKLYWGEPRVGPINVLKSDQTQNNEGSELAGVVAGTVGRLRVILSRCDPWACPKQGDMIDLYTTADVSLGTFTVLDHMGDDADAVRTLVYGEEAA